MASAPRNPSARKSARSLCLRISAYHEASSSGKYPTYTTASQHRPYIASRRTLMFTFSCDLPPSPGKRLFEPSSGIWDNGVKLSLGWTKGSQPRASPRLPPD